MTGIVSEHPEINGTIDIATPAVGVLPSTVAQAPHIVAPGCISGVVQVVHGDPGPGLTDRGADVVLPVIVQTGIDPVVIEAQRTQRLPEDIQIIDDPRVLCLGNAFDVRNHQRIIS